MSEKVTSWKHMAFLYIVVIMTMVNKLHMWHCCCILYFLNNSALLAVVISCPYLQYPSSHSLSLYLDQNNLVVKKYGWSYFELSLDSKTACIVKVLYKTIRHTQCSLFLEQQRGALPVKNSAVHYINSCQQSAVASMKSICYLGHPAGSIIKTRADATM